MRFDSAAGVNGDGLPLAEVLSTVAGFEIIGHLNAEGPYIEERDQRIDAKYRVLGDGDGIDLPQEGPPLDLRAGRSRDDRIGRRLDPVGEERRQVDDAPIELTLAELRVFDVRDQTLSGPRAAGDTDGQHERGEEEYAARAASVGRLKHGHVLG
jgi:hypothetical protein